MVISTNLLKIIKTLLSGYSNGYKQIRYIERSYDHLPTTEFYRLAFATTYEINKSY